MTRHQNATAQLMGDPEPDRLERAEALRRSLPEPRELPLSDWLAGREFRDPLLP